MADISKIKVNNVTYDVVDTDARGRLDLVENDVSSISTELPLKADASAIVDFKNIYFSNTIPTPEQGENGDIWLVY